MYISFQGLRSAVLKHFEGDSRITKDGYQIFVAIVASLCFLSHGFIIIQSDLLLTNESFLAIGQTARRENAFTKHLHTTFFAGELLGERSFPVTSYSKYLTVYI